MFSKRGISPQATALSYNFIFNGMEFNYIGNKKHKMGLTFKSFGIRSASFQSKDSMMLSLAISKFLQNERGAIAKMFQQNKEYIMLIIND